MLGELLGTVISILLLCLIVDMFFGGRLGLTGSVFGLFMQLFQMGLQVFTQLVGVILPIAAQMLGKTMTLSAKGLGWPTNVC
jgi:hypothetical protein